MMDKNTQDIAVATIKTIVLPVVAWIGKGYWDRRTHRKVKGLKVFPRDGRVMISPDVADDHSKHHSPPAEAAAIHFCFLNQTGHKVYLHDAFVSKLAAHITPHANAARDAGTSAYELKFRTADEQTFHLREVPLETSASAFTSLPLNGAIHPMPQGWFRRLLLRLGRRPPNYLLCYTVTMDGRAYRVCSPQ